MEGDDKMATEMVNHPGHYQSAGGIEVIDVIESFGLGFCLGNAVKYILRCGKKDAAIQELQKAKWYIDREISNLQKVDNATAHMAEEIFRSTIEDAVKKSRKAKKSSSGSKANRV